MVKYILFLFTGWRIALLAITFYGLSTVPYITQPGYVLNRSTTNTDYISRWGNWDGGHYLDISQKGYTTIQTVFFPLYSLIIKLVTLIGISPLWAGLLISHLATIFALFFLYKLVLLDYDNETAQKATLLLLAFPTSFYLVAVYNESLFLALTIASFYYSRTKNIILASLFAGLASVTRPIGIAVIIAISAEYLIVKSPQFKLHHLSNTLIKRLILYLTLLYLLLNIFLINVNLFNQPILAGILVTLNPLISTLIMGLSIIVILIFLKRNLDINRIYNRKFIYLCLSILPLLTYLLFLYITQNDFIAFYHNENAWGRKLVFPWDTPIAYFVSLKNSNFFILGGAQLLLEFAFFILFLCLMLYSLFKLRLSYIVFFLIAFLMPVSSGTLTAIHRYGLVIFPVFILLAMTPNKYFFTLWLLLSTMFLGLISVLYINAYWVS